jgi:hypothetical protein
MDMKRIYTLGIRFSGEEDDVFVFDRFCSIGRNALQLESIGEFVIDYFCQFEKNDSLTRSECSEARKKLRPKYGQAKRVAKDIDGAKARLIEIRDFFAENDWGFFNLREGEVLSDPVWSDERGWGTMIPFGDYYI